MDKMNKMNKMKFMNLIGIAAVFASLALMLSACSQPVEDGNNLPLKHAMSLNEAVAIAQSGECAEKGTVAETGDYNPNSKTWWIGLEMKNEYENNLCNPACVVSEETKLAEINWRCTGAIPPPESEIDSFEECAAAGNPVMESYPRQCSANGKTFTEIVSMPPEPSGMYPDECYAQGGNTVRESAGCSSGRESIGSVRGFSSPYICCAKMQPVNTSRQYCNADSRNADICYMLYAPVCGYTAEGMHASYSNNCFACINSSVEYYIEGGC